MNSQHKVADSQASVFSGPPVASRAQAQHAQQNLPLKEGNCKWASCPAPGHQQPQAKCPPRSLPWTPGRDAFVTAACSGSYSVTRFQTWPRMCTPGLSSIPQCGSVPSDDVPWFHRDLSPLIRPFSCQPCLPSLPLATEGTSVSSDLRALLGSFWSPNTNGALSLCRLYTHDPRPCHKPAGRCYCPHFSDGDTEV